MNHGFIELHVMFANDAVAHHSRVYAGVGISPKL